MRIVAFLVIILFIPSITAIPQTGKVRIDGQIIGYTGTDRVEYGISPTWSTGNNGSVRPDSLGRFTIEKSISDTEYFFMYYL